MSMPYKEGWWNEVLVNSKGLRFGEDEFGLITSLSSGPIPRHNETSMRIRGVYFNSENKVRNDH